MQSTKRKKPQHFLDYRLKTYLIKNANCNLKVADFLWSFEPQKKKKFDFCEVHNDRKRTIVVKQNHKQECMKYETFSAMKA